MTPDAAASPSRISLGAVWVMAALLALLTPNVMLTGQGRPDDRSVFAYIGWLMHRGYRPYLDVWDHKGPLLYWLNWLGWALTPGSTAGIGILQAVVTLGMFACLLWILRRLASPVAILLTALFALTLVAQAGEGGNMAETWALLPLAAVHVVVYACAQRGWRWSDAFTLSVCFSACFAIRPNLCLEPALAILVALHFVRRDAGFRFALSALFWTALLTLAELLVLFVPIWLMGAGHAFLDAYLGYNTAYSRFVTLRDHLLGFGRLLLVMRTMALLYAALAAWCLLLLGRSGSRIHPSYRVFLLLALPAEVFSAALSGRSFYHYLVPLVPVTTVLCGLALQWLFESIGHAKTFWKTATAVVLCVAVILQVRKYLIFLHEVLKPHFSEIAVAAYIDRVTSPSQRILPVGDVGSDTIALRAQRPPSSRFIFQLPIVHEANANAASDRALFLRDLAQHPPAVIFSTPGPVGNLCDVPSPTEQEDRAEARRDGYDYGLLRTQLAPYLAAHYRLVSRSAFGDTCVYVRKGIRD